MEHDSFSSDIFSQSFSKLAIKLMLLSLQYCTRKWLLSCSMWFFNISFGRNVLGQHLKGELFFLKFYLSILVVGSNNLLHETSFECVISCQVNGFCVLCKCVLRWVLRLTAWENEWEHLLQVNGFSPEFVLMWLFSLPASVNALEHSLQSNDFSP